MTLSVSNHRPRNIDVDRTAGTVTVTWVDGHKSKYALAWLRANCPCANCREERLVASRESNTLRLSDAPPPSAEMVNAELVGGYAIQFQWADGHEAGIYSFSMLRSSCPCPECNPDGSPISLE